MGRRLRFLDVHQMPLVGGALCLDFTNTTGARRSGEPRERLHDFGDLLVWSERAGIVTSAESRRIARRAKAQPSRAARYFTKAIEIREDLYATFAAIAAGIRPPTASIARIGEMWGRAQGTRTLVLARAGFSLAANDQSTDLERLAAPVLESAVALLTSDQAREVRKCVECDWLFIDETKNGSRRWCKDTCGNRVRARERYARLRGGRRT